MLRLTFNRSMRPGLVGFHQAAIADHVGGQDGGEFALHDPKLGRAPYHGLHRGCNLEPDLGPGRELGNAAALLRFAESRGASILPPHVARQNIQLGPVFRDRASRDRDAALAENFDDFLVAQRRAARTRLLTRSRIASFTLVLLIETPLAVW